MALARIFSRHPEQTTALSEQLQQQGYKVEVLSPDEAPTTFADLEIQLEVCDPADVLRRAGELAARLQCDIAVAPGTLQPESSLAQTPASLSPPEEQAPPTLVPDSQVAPAEPMPIASATSETTSPALMPEEHIEEHIKDATPAASERFLPQAARSFGGAVAACISAVNELLASARDQFRESGELARIKLAHARALREQRLLDLTRRRAEAQQHLMELRSGRKVLDAYLQLQRAERQAIAEPQFRSASAQAAAPLGGPPASGSKLGTGWISPRTRLTVLACLASASALFVIGLTVAAFHSRQPVSNARGVTVQTSSPALPAPQPKQALPPRPSPVVRKARPKPAVQAHKAKPKPAQKNQDVVASDVVVRRFPSPKPTPTTQANGWKHFSDMQN